jgi:hypothetical protein
MKSVLMQAMTRVIALSNIMALLLLGSFASATTLDQELNQVDRLRTGFTTPFDEVERRCDDLLQRYTKPEEQAKIYFELAQVEGQSGMQRPEKLIEYVKKALELPIDPSKKLRLYIYWGDAIQVSHRGVHNEELVAARREAVMPYLHGLRETIKYDLPEEKPDHPHFVTITYYGPTDTDEYQELLRKRQEQTDAKRKAVFQRQMIEHRDVITSQISLMYSRFPLATDELQKLAMGVLGDEAAANRLMSHVKGHIQKRLDNMVRAETNKLVEDLMLPSADTGMPNVLSGLEKSEEDVQAFAATDVGAANAAARLLAEATELRGILIRAMVVEFPLSEIDKVKTVLGTKQQGFSTGKKPEGGEAVSSGLTVAIPQTDNLEALIKMLATGEIKGKVLWSPVVLTDDGKEATVKTTKGKIHYLERVKDNLYELKEMEDPGSILQVTPTVKGDRIEVAVKLHLTDIGGRAALPDAPDLEAGMPLMNMRQVSATVAMPNGRTVVLGGLRGKASETLVLLTGKTVGE